MLAERDRSHPPLAVVGRDPRASGEMLEAAVVAGLTSAGANVVRVGVLPTPAVAYLVGESKADLGVMLSASHNPMPDNGIKLFAAGGHKLPDEIEDAHRGGDRVGHGRLDRPTGAGVGRVHDLLDGAEHYVAAPGRLDCRTGSTASRSWSTAPTARLATSRPTAYREAGAEVIAIHAEPDGLNINDDCGSTHLDAVRGRRRRARRRPGHRPRRRRRPLPRGRPPPATMVDGDQIMAILALAMRDAGTLTERHAGHHGDEQPGPAAGHARRRASG